MNKLYLYFLLILVLCLSACDPNRGKIMDYSPMDITFSVVDDAGNDLLDPESELNILDRITVRYNGEEYLVGELDGSPDTRAYKPHWEGLYTRYSEHNECWLLLFGEFSPDFGDHHNDKLTVDWGDGTQDQITFDFYVRSNVHRRFWVNGKKETPFFFKKTLL